MESGTLEFEDVRGKTNQEANEVDACASVINISKQY